MSVITCSKKSLNRSVDVSTSVTKNPTELSTDLSVLVFATPNTSFLHGADRLRIYTSIEGLEADGFVLANEPHKAATAFFAQTDRAKKFALGAVFDTAQSGYMRSKGVEQTIADWVAVSDGEFEMVVDGVSFDVTLCDFSSVTDLDDVAAVIQVRAQVALAGVLVTNEGDSTFRFTSPTTGVLSTFAELDTVAVPAGTDISGIDFINAQDDSGDESDNVVIVDGYVPGTIADELALIAEAGLCSDTFIYGYTLDATYRDSADQTLAASFALSRRVQLGLTVNSPLSKDAGSTSDIGALLNDDANIRVFTNYHDNAFYYPAVAILAQMLGVDYNAATSVKTAKFKDLIGIPTVAVTETELAVLNSKRINVFTAVGNNSRTFREGTESADSFFIDELINLDNFEEQLQTEVYNVFLQNPTVPFNAAGVALIHSAIERICNLYVFNGAFSERALPFVAGNNDPLIESAFTITSTPLSLVSVADRAARKGPPFQVKVNLSGSIHSVDIAINAFS